MAQLKPQKCLVEYFTYLDSCFISARANLVLCYKLTFRINNLIERQNKITKANTINTPLSKYDDLIEKLCYFIDTDINRCINEMQQICNNLHNEYEILNKKMINFENSCDDIDFRENNILTNGSAYQPSLSDLLEFSMDGTQIIHHIWSQIKFAIIQILSFKENCDFQKLLAEYFVVDETADDRLKYILMLTQFCNQIDL